MTIEEEYEKETGKTAIRRGTDGVHCIIIEAPSAAFVGWLKKKLTAALERENVLMDIVLGSRADLDAIDDYSKPLGCMERIDEALARVQSMKEDT